MKNARVVKKMQNVETAILSYERGSAVVTVVNANNIIAKDIRTKAL